MNLPFTPDQFFSVFVSYNRAIWPAQVVAYALGLGAVLLAIREKRASGRVISAILGLFWVWMGMVYHVMYFKPINPAAAVIGALFIFQGTMFLILGSGRERLAFHFTRKPIPLVGACFVLYAMVVYYALAAAFGHSYPAAPMFGVAPCPTVIFTFGILLWATRPVPWYLYIIPLIWSLIGTTAAWTLDVPPDYGLGLAGVVGTILLVLQNKELKPRPAEEVRLP